VKRSLASAIGIAAVAIVGLGAYLLLTDRGDQPEPPLVQVPDSHAAFAMQNAGFPTDGSPEASPGALCAAGGGGWQVCLVPDDGILAVVAFVTSGFGISDDMVVVLEGSGVPERFVSVPAGGDSIFGVEGASGFITATVLVDGEEVGAFSGPVGEQ
jgi:hypothetical protein